MVILDVLHWLPKARILGCFYSNTDTVGTRMRRMYGILYTKTKLKTKKQRIRPWSRAGRLSINLKEQRVIPQTVLHSYSTQRFCLWNPSKLRYLGWGPFNQVLMYRCFSRFQKHQNTAYWLSHSCLRMADRDLLAGYHRYVHIMKFHCS